MHGQGRGGEARFGSSSASASASATSRAGLQFDDNNYDAASAAEKGTDGHFDDDGGTAATAGGLLADMQYEELQQLEELETIMGFPRFVEGDPRMGWMVNMVPSQYRESEFATPKDAVDFFFLEEDGGSFKVSVIIEPYFFIACESKRESEVEDYLRRNYDRVILSIQRVQKEDLDLVNHLSGCTRTMLKLSFANTQDMMSVRKIVLPASFRNRSKLDAEDVYNHFDLTEAADGANRRTAQRSPLDLIIDVREYDISFYVRAAIDCDFRVGLWYHVKAVGPGKVTLERDDSKIARAEPIVLAFDIETTKLPLKFPDASFDSIMMISYMIDGQGYLITNREIVSADIDDFEYTPKPEYEGVFTVFNESNEEALLKRFFTHIRSAKPTVFVTYNGDFFDWPFVEARSIVHGIDMKKEIGFSVSNGEYKSRHAIHMDAFKWVKRDSYLPQGSQGLKAVTHYKLGYDPAELDPEDMTRFASEQPQVLASYSVSDAVATYYLYMKYVHPFIFSLCNIIPLNPDDVLRRGSGTLCEHLLMVESYKANVIMPNKHVEQTGKLFEGHLLATETYVGGHVEALEAGVFRSDLPVQFHLVPSAFQQLIDEVDKALQFSIEVEGNLSIEDITNYEEVRNEIIGQLEGLRNKPHCMAKPQIYHLDVAAMYPNIILTNRLQPDAMVSESQCASCDFYNGPESSCQRRMDWSWRGEFYPAKRSEYNMLRNQLEREMFPSPINPNLQLSFHDLKLADQNEKIRQRVEEYSKKVYAKKYSSKVINKESIVCQRENPFYINTVKNFRDRRYLYKRLLKDEKKNVDVAAAQGNLAALAESKKMVVVYDSLQLAHKCILNSFYGYVMRKGARWYSMEMAGIVCLTGAKIIQLARSRVEQIGRPLELDTDGIWCILPEAFPENFVLKCVDGKKHFISYPCVMLNHLVHAEFTNHQYQDLKETPVVPGRREYDMHSENSIFFEVDGPYKAMILPASLEEDKLLKKRYAVFNDDGSLAELKGFEVKRRGELKLIKNFQTAMFSKFLEGTTTAECYGAVADVANHWLDVLYSKGEDLEDSELYDLISENRSMSKSLQEYGAQKSTSITTARRLAEFLGDSMVKDKGLACKFIISEKPSGIPVSERAVPVSIFFAEESIKKHFLRKWLRYSSLDVVNVRDIIDWKYYLERFASVIQKLITIPAALQGVSNPIPRVQHPDWLNRKLSLMDGKHKQYKINDMFQRLPKGSTAHIIETGDANSVDYAMDDDSSLLNEIGGIGDMEDFGSQGSRPGGPSLATVRRRNRVAPITLEDEPEPELPEVVPGIEEDYSAWLVYQKKRWKEKRQKRAQNRALGVGLNRRIRNGGTATFFQQQTRNILEMPWQILQIAQTESAPGEFNVWAVINNVMYCVKLQIPRRFYLNCRSKQDLDNVRVPITVSIRDVQKDLPRSHVCMSLYEYTMPESVYIENSEAFISMFNHQDVEGVYELKVPLLFRALLSLGCVASVSKSRAMSGKGLSAGFDLDDLKHVSIEKNPYLKSSEVKYLYLFHAGNGVRHIFGLFSSAQNSARVFFVDPGRNASAIPNVGRIYEERRQERLDAMGEQTSTQYYQPSTQSSSQGMSEAFSCPEEMDIAASVFSTDVEALVAVNQAIQGYLDGRHGPTVCVVQSPFSLKDLHRKGAHLLSSSFPVLTTSTLKKDNVMPALGWQVIAARRMVSHLLNLNGWLHERLELARYSDVPIGNLENDYSIFLSDLFFARRLSRNDSVLWFSYSNKPDLGGREEDDNFEMDEFVNPEIQNSGTYNNVCVEIDLVNLAFNTIMQSAQIAEVENVSAGLDTMSSGYGAKMSDLSHEESGESQLMVSHFTSSDEKVVNEKTFRMIKDMVHEWLYQFETKHDRFSEMMLNHLYRWITSSGSRMYDPALFLKIQGYMKKVFLQLLSEFRKMGSNPVFASFDKLVLVTCKASLPTAFTYIKYVMDSIRQKPLFSKIGMESVQFWDHLFWLDRFNFGGIVCDDPLALAQHDSVSVVDGKNLGIEMKWNIMEYLPPVLQVDFKKIIGEFIFEVHREKSARRMAALNPTDETIDKACEDMSSFLRTLVSRFLKKKLLKIVPKMDKKVHEDASEDRAFPRLPGSRLEYKNPALEFVKSIIAVLELDPVVEREVRVLRKDLLSLLHIREFSDESMFKNPCEPFKLPRIICEYCNLTRDLDLTRDHDLRKMEENVEQPVEPDNEEDEDASDCEMRYERPSKRRTVAQPNSERLTAGASSGEWLCVGCGTEHDKGTIEQILVEMVSKKLSAWQMQDLTCTRCRLVKADNLSRYCGCSGQYAPAFSHHEFLHKLRMFGHIASFYNMRMLSEIVSWALTMV